jgi:hypothetical protein
VGWWPQQCIALCFKGNMGQFKQYCMQVRACVESSNMCLIGRGAAGGAPEEGGGAALVVLQVGYGPLEDVLHAAWCLSCGDAAGVEPRHVVGTSPECL